MQLNESEHDLPDGCLSGQHEGEWHKKVDSHDEGTILDICLYRFPSTPNIISDSRLLCSFLSLPFTFSQFLVSPLHPHAQPPSSHLPYRTLSSPRCQFQFIGSGSPISLVRGPGYEIAAAETQDATFHSILPSHSLSMVITDTSLTQPTPTWHVGVGIQASSRNLSNRSTFHIPTRFNQARGQPCPKFEVPSFVQNWSLWGYRVSDANNKTRQITINSFSQQLLKDHNETANEYCLLYACGRSRLCLRVSFYLTTPAQCSCCWWVIFLK